MCIRDSRWPDQSDLEQLQFRWDLQPLLGQQWLFTAERWAGSGQSLPFAAGRQGTQPPSRSDGSRPGDPAHDRTGHDSSKGSQWLCPDPPGQRLATQATGVQRTHAEPCLFRQPNTGEPAPGPGRNLFPLCRFCATWAAGTTATAGIRPRWQPAHSTGGDPLPPLSGSTVTVPADREGSGTLIDEDFVVISICVRSAIASSGSKQGQTPECVSLN